MMLDQPGWRLQPDKCRADLDFIEWAREQPHPPMSVLQMGPGLHHQVGLQLPRLGTYVASLTASPAELAVWNRMVARRGGLSFRYICLLADIYTFGPQAMWFDTLYLPHLGEMLEAESPQPAIAIRNLLERLESGGRLIFYTGSSAWDRVEVLPRTHPWLEREGEYKSLEIWRRR